MGKTPKIGSSRHLETPTRKRNTSYEHEEASSSGFQSSPLMRHDEERKRLLSDKQDESRSDGQPNGQTPEFTKEDINDEDNSGKKGLYSHAPTKGTKDDVVHPTWEDVRVHRRGR